MIKNNSRVNRMALGARVVLLLVLSQPAWSDVFVLWSSPDLPSSRSLGVDDIVFSWKEGIAPLLAAGRRQGYRVYVETPMPKAKTAAEEAAKAGCTGVILDIADAESAGPGKDVETLQVLYPHLRFLVLNLNGKRPEMRGSLIIKRDSVLEVSSPTAQPWIDTNLALVKVEERAHQTQVPLYTFSWSDQGQQKTQTADDYSLAVAEAGAFRADLVLQLDDQIQQSLYRHDAQAWALWNQVRSTLKFFSNRSAGALEPAANVAVLVDRLDTSDEVLNLLSRHNIPFRVLLTSDLTEQNLKGVDILIVFAKPNKEIGEQINSLAALGATVVLVDAPGHYPWQKEPPVQLNEHTTSYATGRGKVLEFPEAISDPETFAQDIRRLLGKRNALLTLWNGLTTIAVPYKDHSGTIKQLDFVNYALDPVRVQVQVKGSFASIQYESPERACCESLISVKREGFTEFVIPDLRITGRVRLELQ